MHHTTTDIGTDLPDMLLQCELQAISHICEPSLVFVHHAAGSHSLCLS